MGDCSVGYIMLIFLFHLYLEPHGEGAYSTLYPREAFKTLLKLSAKWVTVLRHSKLSVIRGRTLN